MAEDLVKLVFEAVVAIIVLIVVGSALGGVLDTTIAPHEGIIYWGPLKAISLIVGIPTAIIAVAVGLVRAASD